MEDHLSRIKALEKCVEQLKNEHKEFFNRIRQLEIDRMEIKTHYEHIEATLQRLTDGIAELQAKPAKRADAAITAAIGIVVGFLLQQIGIFK